MSEAHPLSESALEQLRTPPSGPWACHCGWRCLASDARCPDGHTRPTYFVGFEERLLATLAARDAEIGRLRECLRAVVYESWPQCHECSAPATMLKGCHECEAPGLCDVHGSHEMAWAEVSRLDAKLEDAKAENERLLHRYDVDTAALIRRIGVHGEEIERLRAQMVENERMAGIMATAVDVERRQMEEIERLRAREAEVDKALQIHLGKASATVMAWRSGHPSAPGYDDLDASVRIIRNLLESK